MNRKGKRFIEPNKEFFVNIYDLMFTIKSVSRNEIVLIKNNVNNIIEKYEDENKLMEMLNYTFPQKTEKDAIFPYDLVQKYVQESN